MGDIELARGDSERRFANFELAARHLRAKPVSRGAGCFALTGLARAQKGPAKMTAAEHALMRARSSGRS